MQGVIVTGAMAILWLVCLYLFGLGLLILVDRDQAQRFLASFGQSPRANWTEAVMRMLVGLAFVIAAPVLDHPLIMRVLGGFLSGTAVLFVLFPGLHRRFAAPAVALVAPFLPLIGVASIILAILLACYLV